MNDNQIAIDNQSIFAAEKVFKKRKRKGKIRLKWLGYPEDQSTWEPEENILDKRLIKHFEHDQKRKPAPCLNRNLPFASFCTNSVSAESSNFNQQINYAFVIFCQSRQTRFLVHDIHRIVQK